MMIMNNRHSQEGEITLPGDDVPVVPGMTPTRTTLAQSEPLLPPFGRRLAPLNDSCILFSETDG